MATGTCRHLAQYAASSWTSLNFLPVQQNFYKRELSSWRRVGKDGKHSPRDGPSGLCAKVCWNFSLTAKKVCKWPATFELDTPNWLPIPVVFITPYANEYSTPVCHNHIALRAGTCHNIVRPESYRHTYHDHTQDTSPATSVHANTIILESYDDPSA